MTTISEKEYATAWKAERRAWKKETAATEGVLYVRSVPDVQKQCSARSGEVMM